jgi:hypothetical protein
MSTIAMFSAGRKLLARTAAPYIGKKKSSHAVRREIHSLVAALKVLSSCHWAPREYEGGDEVEGEGDDEDVNETPEARRARHARESKEFRRRIRHYNDSFAFVSLLADVNPRLAAQIGGSYTFKAHGAMYHTVGALDAEEGTLPAFAQLYIFDGEDEQLERRTRAFRGLNPNIARKIQSVLHMTHPYARALINNAQRLRDDRSVVLRLGIVESALKDPRVYNKPAVSEVAALIPIGSEQASNTRHLFIQHSADRRLQYMNEQSQNYLTLRYPFMFPWGEHGWTYNFPRVHMHWRPGTQTQHGTNPATTAPEPAPEDDDENGDDGDRGTAPTSTAAATRADKVTQQQWWRFVLQVRRALSPILFAGRLFHEMVVDAFASISSARLTWCRNNQKNLRLARAEGLVDALAHEHWTAADIGRRVILPPSFTGRPRQMRDAYLDAMALTRYFGNPDYFLTFTCNTSWIEITRELKPGQRPTDRPDLVNRTFNLKLKELFSELLQNSILGRVAALVWTIEFQKRGLPHAHILLIMEPSDRPQLPEHVDHVVCAEIPDPSQEPLLHDVVCRFMLHHPCGPANPNASCMRAGRCRWSFRRNIKRRPSSKTVGPSIAAATMAVCTSRAATDTLTRIVTLPLTTRISLLVSMLTSTLSVVKVSWE